MKLRTVNYNNKFKITLKTQLTYKYQFIASIITLSI